MYSHFELYLGFDLTRVDEIKPGTTVHAMSPAQLILCLLMDALATLGVSASAGMVLASKAGIFLLHHRES